MRSGRLLLIGIIGIVIAMSASLLFTGVEQVASADSSEVLTLSPASNMAMATANGSLTSAIPERQPYNPNIDVYLTGVKLGQTANTIKSHFANSERIKIYNESGVEIGNNDRVGTGYIVRLYNESLVMTDEITICIKGDVDGNGYINLDDVTAISMHMRGNVLLEGARLVAADVYPTIGGDGYISGQDKIYMSLQVSNLILHPTTYTITFDSNGGNTVTSITEEAGVAITPPAAPTLTGYNFDGWYSDVGLTTAYTFTTMPSNNITVYAKWTPITYNIAYDGNGFTSGSTPSSTHTYNQAQALNANGYLRTGYTFEGWATTTDGDVTYTDSNIVTNLTIIQGTTITLYANWTPIEYTIEYDGNGATSGETDSSEHFYGQPKALNVNGYIRDNYDFAGWSTTEDGEVEYINGQSVNNLSTVQGEVIILYAKWTGVTYTITLEAGNGSSGSNSEGWAWSNNSYIKLINYDSTVGVLPSNPTKSELEFRGWWSEDNGGGTQLTTSTVVKGDITYYAKWEIPSLYTRSGNFIWFGEYPQTIKADGITVGTTAESDGYFLGSDGERYARVVANPYGSNYEFSNEALVTSGTAYYFKVEPIKWRILEESDGTAFMLAELVLDNKRYHSSKNNYMNSEIRAWINNQFYNKAFNALHKQIILTTEVDNSEYSTGTEPNPNACANTNDKIFLPSYREVVDTSFGFSDSESFTETREIKTSDYSRATGAIMSTTIGSQYGNGSWWLRSPASNPGVRSIAFIGNIGSGRLVGDNQGGIVPALRIQL